MKFDAVHFSRSVHWPKLGQTTTIRRADITHWECSEGWLTLHHASGFVLVVPSAICEIHGQLEFQARPAEVSPAPEAAAEPVSSSVPNHDPNPAASRGKKASPRR